MTRALTKEEVERFADVRGAAEQARWFVTNQYVGGGGGADVLLAMRASDLDALHSAYAAVPTTWGESLAQVIAERFVSGRDVLAAIKIPRLRSPRIKAEIQAMEECSHPHLVRLLASDKSDVPAWFVMEYFPRGTLEQHRSSYHGKPVEVLSHLRGMVEAVALLNKKGYFHRDIKPNNMFLAEDGRWVLGDLGIVLDADDTAHTPEHQQLWSRDWIPDWCVEFPESYDAVAEVHMLAKSALYLISGKKPRASHVDAVNLVEMFPKAQGVNDVQELLREEIKVRKEQTASKSADMLLDKIDQLLRRVSFPTRPSALFQYIEPILPMVAGGNPQTDLSRISMYIPGPTKRLFGSFKFRADQTREMGTFRYRLYPWTESALGTPLAESRPLRVEGPPTQGAWSMELPVPLSEEVEPGWYLLSLDTSSLGAVRLVGAMVYG